MTKLFLLFFKYLGDHFWKYNVGGFVGEHEAGQRLFQTAHDPRCSKSGVYWSWNGGPREGRGSEALEKGGQISGGGGAGGGWDSIFENDQSSKVLNIDSATKLFQYSTEITGAEWPDLKQITSPCPTLKVIGAVTQGMVKREELKRMREMGRPGIIDKDDVVTDMVGVEKATTIAAANDPSNAGVRAPQKATQKVKGARKLSKRQRLVIVADKTVGMVLGNTVGRVARFVGKRILGKVPETAKTSSFFVEDTVVTIPDSPSDISVPEVDGQDLLEEAIASQLKKESTVHIDQEDEALFAELYRDESLRVEEVLSGKDTGSL
jgi:hypothetical protein